MNCKICGEMLEVTEPDDDCVEEELFYVCKTCGATHTRVKDEYWLDDTVENKVLQIDYCKHDEFKVFDNGGKTIDRYTVVFNDGDYVGMSESPFHPQGFCQHGEGLDFDGDLSHLGKEISLTDLPKDCQKVVVKDMADMSASEVLRCPKCGVEIDRLLVLCVQTTQEYMFARGDELEFDHRETFEHNTKECRCPECEEMLFENGCDGVAFLKGEKNAEVS